VLASCALGHRSVVTGSGKDGVECAKISRVGRAHSSRYPQVWRMTDPLKPARADDIGIVAQAHSRPSLSVAPRPPQSDACRRRRSMGLASDDMFPIPTRS
jgi:hypothetical protein